MNIKTFIIIFFLSSCSSCMSDQKDNKIEPSKKNIKLKNTIKNGFTEKKISDSNFIKFWIEFCKVVKTKNFEAFKTISLDSLMLRDKKVLTNTFIKGHFVKVFDGDLINQFDNISKINFIEDEIEVNKIDNIIPNNTNKYVIQKAQIDLMNKTDIIIFELTFLKTVNGYKFYKFDRFG